MPNGELGTLEAGDADPPAGWHLDMGGDKMTTFTNPEEDLEVIVRAVCNGSKHRPGHREPAHYVVRLHDAGITLQTRVQRDRSAKVSTRSEAFEVARSFMEEFTPASV